MQLTAVVSIVLLALAGCMDTNPPPSSPPPTEPECPIAAAPQTATINTEIGEHNATTPAGTRGASYSYHDFAWEWPAGSRIAIHVRAEWDAGLLGEKSMQLRAFDSDHPLNDDFGSAAGPSPIDLNFTMMVPSGARLAVGMEPHGLAVSKASVDTHVVLVQTLLCS